MKKTEYEALADKKAPKSRFWRDTIAAWVVGGFVCIIGQVLVNVFLHYGFSQDMAYCCASLSLIFIAALLTGLHIYDNIAKWAGGGLLVPITGFSNAVASPAMEFKSEGFIAGTGAKMFSIAGPVIIYGTLASVIYGVILQLT